jgi:hypothetical protein
MRILDNDHLKGCIALLTEEVSAHRGCDETYRAVVGHLRHYPCSSEAGISVHFSDCPLSAICASHGIFPDGVSVPEARIAEIRQLLADTLDFIAEREPALSSFINTVVTDIVFFESSRIGGGTGSHLPGVVCFSPGVNWEPYDMAESLIHECAHLSTFLCDMVHGIFTRPAKELEKEDYQVVSAVRKGLLRPLDKAFHSALVSVPLFYFESKLGQSKIAKEFGLAFEACCEGLSEKRELFTEYGQSLLDELLVYRDKESRLNISSTELGL